jgi:hypothetical protein
MGILAPYASRPAPITRRRALLLFGGLLLPASRARAQVDPIALKSVFLFNFAQFVEWPVSAFPSADAPLVIGVLGVDPFGKALDEVLRNERARSRRILLQRFKQLSEIESCHILYISRSEANHLDEIFEDLQGKPVLTVAEIGDFARRGGMIEMITERKVRLRVNLKAAKTAGMSISAKMLQLAEVI